MSRKKNSVLINEHALNREPLPLMPSCPRSSKRGIAGNQLLYPVKRDFSFG